MITYGRMFRFCTIALILLSGSVSSQPEWVRKVLLDSVKMPIAPEAIALVLHHSAEVEIRSTTSARSHIRFVARILKSSGDEFGTIREAVRPNVRVNHLSGWKIAADGSTTSLKDEDIIEVASEVAGNYYNDDRVLIATLRDVKAGSLVAFEYDIDEDDWTSGYQSFEFQVQEPVLFAQFSVKVPGEWRLHKAEWQLEGINFEEREGRLIWSARELPYRPDEPLMPSWRSLTRRISVSAYHPTSLTHDQFHGWSAVSRWSAQLQDQAAVPDDAIKSHVLQLTRGMTKQREKLELIAAFASDEIRYVAVELDKGRWQPRPATTTLYNRYGDCKDKTALMRAMLRAIDIPSSPVLANSDVRVRTELPSPFQFNHCIVAVPLEVLSDTSNLTGACASGWLFFDPTDTEVRLGSLPSVLQGGKVLLATMTDSMLVELPLESPASSLRRYRAEVHVSDDGSLSADVIISDFGDRAVSSRYTQRHSEPSKILEAWQSYLAKSLSFPKVSAYKSGFAGDSAWESFHVTSGSCLLKAGANSLLRVDLLHPIEPPRLSKEKRSHPVYFGPAHRTEAVIDWRLPIGWTITAEIPTLQSSCEAVTIDCNIVMRNGRLRYLSVEQYAGGLMSVDKYPEARKVSRAISASRSLTVVVKKP